MGRFRKKLKSIFHSRRPKETVNAEPFPQFDRVAPPVVADASPPPSPIIEQQQPEQQQPKVVVPFRTLHEAACLGSLPGVEWLSQNDLTPDEIHRALIAAATCGHTEIITFLLLLDGVDVNTADVNGRTALHHAIRAGHGKAVRVLIEHGADPFRGSPSPIALAESLWNPKPLTLLREVIEERYPGKCSRFAIRKHDEEQENQEDKVDRTSENTDAGNPKMPTDTGKQRSTVRNRAAPSLWPDRVLFRKGERLVLQPSDPSYWN